MATLTETARLGIITGLQKEAACLRAGVRRLPKSGQPMLFAAAGDAGVAEEAALRMVAEGARGLVSFGIAGGLDPSMGPGVIVVADRVIAPDGEVFSCHEPWVSRLLQHDGGFDSGPILGSDDAVLKPARKAKLFREHGAIAVDMESHAVAAVAKASGVPFIAVRAIGDPASRAIPRAALAGLAPDGRTRALPVLAALLKRPKDIAGLFRIARDTNAALAALKQAAARGLLEVLSES